MSKAAIRYKKASKAKALRHFKVDPILKILATFHDKLDYCREKL